MIKIISADWGGLDVASVIEERFIHNNEIHLSANNDLFTDPKVGHTKELRLVIEYDGKIIEEIVNENAHFHFPFPKHQTDWALILTSCNRVDQINLALSVNSRIIGKPFTLIVADGSTPHLDANGAILMHQATDPYNLINDKNYNSNWEQIEEHIKTLPNIKDYRVIHQSPRQQKQEGEAELMSLGITAASMLGCKYGIKLTGVCNLKRNPFDDKLGEESVYTWKRTGYGHKSTRVVMFRPDEFGALLSQQGWSEWVYTYDFIERKLEKIINKNLPADKIKHFDLDERDIIVDEGIGRNDHREIIMANLEKHNLLDCNDRYIKSFLEGNIW